MKRLSILAASLVLAASAQAATVSFEYGMPLVLATTEINQTGNLGLFDTSLGTLTGASLEVFGGAVMSYGGTNTAAQAQSARLTSTVELAWSSSLGALNPFLLDAILLSSTSGTLSYATGQTRNFGPDAQNGSSIDNLGTLAALQAAGGGTFGVSCSSLSGLAVSGGGGNISTTQATTAGCGARIVYTYTAASVPVPEPTSLALVGLALAAAGFTAARRKA
jgi:PEP-CTERM motif